MQAYQKTIPSTHLFSTTTPICEHTYLRQSICPSLPPLYIATKLHDHWNSSFPLQRMFYLQHSHEFLGPMKPCSLFIGRDVNGLRKELEGGMSKDRREQLRMFVTGLEDKGQKRAAEVYLPRYPGFVLDCEGNLHYEVGDRLFVENNEAIAGARRCILM